MLQFESENRGQGKGCVVFSGSVTGATEANCPHCGELLTAGVNDPMSEESCQCGQCIGAFEVDWGEGQVQV